MREYITKHFAQYVLMMLILITGVVTIFSEIDQSVKLLTIVSLSAIYFIWGIWHHWEDHAKITLTTAAEYALVALLIFWVLLSVL